VIARSARSGHTQTRVPTGDATAGRVVPVLCGPVARAVACPVGAGARAAVGAGSMNDETEAGSVAWRDRPALNGADLIDFLALRRMCGLPDSSVVQVGEHFMEDQRPVLPFLADGLTALIEVGHATLGDSRAESCGMRPVVVTASGRARYEELCDRQGIVAYPVVVIDGTPGR
jgi:hypothetical protein